MEIRAEIWKREGWTRLRLEAASWAQPTHYLSSHNMRISWFAKYSTNIPEICLHSYIETFSILNSSDSWRNIIQAPFYLCLVWQYTIQWFWHFSGRLKLYRWNKVFSQITCFAMWRPAGCPVLCLACTTVLGNKLHFFKGLGEHHWLCEYYQVIPNLCSWCEGFRSFNCWASDRDNWAIAQSPDAIPVFPKEIF